LIDNALRFAKAGTTPKIRVWTERGSSKVRLWIADDGIGIESRFHDRIFGLFEQVQPTGYTEGTGIGLAIVKKGMQRQGGDAGVESEPGKGSRFWLDFAMAGRAGGERVEFTAAA